MAYGTTMALMAREIFKRYRTIERTLRLAWRGG